MSVPPLEPVIGFDPFRAAVRLDMAESAISVVAAEGPLSRRCTVYTDLPNIQPSR